MVRLRDPETGCPWDREQTLESLKPCVLEEAYELLGCRRSDPNDVVRRAYRNAAKRYHPDLLREKGRSESQVKDATEMMAKVNAAWDLIKEARGL